MTKIAVLLKGAHKARTTVQLTPGDIVAATEFRDGATTVEFRDVLPTYPEGNPMDFTQDNIVYSVGIADSLDGEAYIIFDPSTTYGLPIAPNGGHIYSPIPAGSLPQ